MSYGDWIAVYAAIVATAALSWQTFVEWKKRRINLNVLADLFIYSGSLEEFYSVAKAFRQGGPFPGIKIWAELTVTNMGQRQVIVSGVRFVQELGELQRNEWEAKERWQLPWTLSEGVTKKCVLGNWDAPELTLERHLRCGIELSTGQTIEAPCISIYDHRDRKNYHFISHTGVMRDWQTSFAAAGGTGSVFGETPVVTRRDLDEKKDTQKETDITDVGSELPDLERQQPLSDQGP